VSPLWHKTPSAVPITQPRAVSAIAAHCVTFGGKPRNGTGLGGGVTPHNVVQKSNATTQILKDLSTVKEGKRPLLTLRAKGISQDESSSPMNTIQITKLAKAALVASLLVVGLVNASAKVLPASEQTHVTIPGEGGSVGGEQF